MAKDNIGSPRPKSDSIEEQLSSNFKHLCMKHGFVYPKDKPVPKVIVESPYAGDIKRNIDYARACLRDCFMRGEYPFASHLLYTQPGVLNDDDPDERMLGIEAGLTWTVDADLTAVYIDLGISKGMEYGIDRALKEGRTVDYRSLDKGWGKWK